MSVVISSDSLATKGNNKPGRSFGRYRGSGFFSLAVLGCCTDLEGQVASKVFLLVCLSVSRYFKHSDGMSPKLTENQEMFHVFQYASSWHNCITARSSLGKKYRVFVVNSVVGFETSAT